MRYDTVIYDLDGTLLNTLGDLAAAVNHAMRVYGYPQHSEEVVCHMVGNGMEKLIRRAMPEGEEGFEEVLRTFKAYYADHSDDLTCAYPGVEEVLDALFRAGVKQAIVSNKGDPFVKELNEKYFSRWVSQAVGEQEGVRRKPYPDSVHKIMNEWNCDPARVLYVGDSEVDVETAKNAGVDCAAVTWGFRSQDVLRAAGAETLIHQPQELVDIVLGK